jgi:hypothetical protein
MKAKSARRTERLAEALKANLKRRKAGGTKTAAPKPADAAPPPQARPKEAFKQG